jgi:tRNA G18 (ribose-2'-O)-methylase SpoU
VAVERVERAKDPRLGEYRWVAQPAELARRGWFVAEGRLVVERLLDEPRFEIESLLVSEAAFEALGPALARRPLRAPVYVCPPHLFEDLTGHDFHRGCLGLVRRPEPLPWTELVAPARSLLVLEAVGNPDNVGGVFRNAAAFGVDGVLLDPRSADPLYRKAIRTSMAATLCVPFATLGAGAVPWPECLAELAASGFELVALTPGAGARDLDEFVLAHGRSERLALLLGAEGEGLSGRALELAQHRVRIAIRPAVDSLNLAVACGIALQRLQGARVPR